MDSRGARRAWHCDIRSANSCSDCSTCIIRLSLSMIRLLLRLRSDKFSSAGLSPGAGLNGAFSPQATTSASAAPQGQPPEEAGAATTGRAGSARGPAPCAAAGLAPPPPCWRGGEHFFCFLEDAADPMGEGSPLMTRASTTPASSGEAPPPSGGATGVSGSTSAPITPRLCPRGRPGPAGREGRRTRSHSFLKSLTRLLMHSSRSQLTPRAFRTLSHVSLSSPGVVVSLQRARRKP
mmetsp:Transcript_31231/g.73025  ORF Transcript_31231/g.73025 Transcript_31231/m.73025 type:complete len:236 (-) Transcript_31231:527-1234(-)